MSDSFITISVAPFVVKRPYAGDVIIPFTSFLAIPLIYERARKELTVLYDEYNAQRDNDDAEERLALLGIISYRPEPDELNKADIDQQAQDITRSILQQCIFNTDQIAVVQSPHSDTPIYVAGGMSWGDDPTEAYTELSKMDTLNITDEPVTVDELSNAVDTHYDILCSMARPLFYDTHASYGYDPDTVEADKKYSDMIRNTVSLAQTYNEEEVMAEYSNTLREQELRRALNDDQRATINTLITMFVTSKGWLSTSQHDDERINELVHTVSTSIAEFIVDDHVHDSAHSAEENN